MPHYSGITTDSEERKQEHQASKMNMRNWRVANDGRPFPSREEAQAWKDAQPGVHDPNGAPAVGPWYGYSFDYE